MMSDEIISKVESFQCGEFWIFHVRKGDDVSKGGWEGR